MSDLDLAIKLKVQADNAKAEIDTIVTALEKLKTATENSANKQKIQEVINLYKDAGKEIDNSATALQKLASVDLGKAAEKLKDFHGKLLDVTSGILNLGKSAVDEAGQIGKLERNITAIGSASGKTKGEISGLLSYLKDFSLSKTGFSDKDIYESAKALEKWNLDVKEILPMASDLAATFGTELSDATTALGRAFTGQRGGLMMLAREYGFTEEKLKAYGAAVTESGAIDDSSIETRKAIIAIMKDMAGASATMADTYGASQKQLENQLNAFKTEIGKSITPALKEYTQGLTELAKMLNSLSDDEKKGLADIILWVGGITLAVGGISKAVTAINEMKLAVTALSGALTPSVLVLGGVVVALTAVGVEIYKAIKAWEDLEKKKADSIYKESQVLTQGFKSMKEAIDEVNKTPLKIAIEGGIEKKLENIESRIRSIRDLQVNDNKDTLWSKAPDWLKNNDSLIAAPTFGEAMDKIKEKMIELEKVRANGGTPAAEEMKKLDEAYKAIGTSLDKLSPKQAGFVKDLEASMQKLKESQSPTVQAQANIKSLGEVFSNVGKSIKKSIEDAGKTKIIDKSYVTSQVQDFNELIKLGESTVAKKKEWLNKALKDERTDATARRAIKLELKKMEEDALKDTEKAHKDSLAEKKRAEQEYRDRVRELSEKAAQDEKDRQEKAAQDEEDRKQKIIEAGRILLEEEKQKREEEEREIKQATERKRQANEELNKSLDDITKSSLEKQIDAINEQVQKWKDAGADREKIEDYTQKSIQKLQNDTFTQFQEQEKQKRDAILETYKSISDLDSKISDKKNERSDLLMGYASDTPIMSMSDAFSKDKNQETNRWNKISGKDEEISSLEDQRDRLFAKLKEQKAEEKKIQEEIQKAQETFNKTLGETTTAYNAIKAASPWDSEIAKINTATDAVNKYNSAKSGTSAASGGNSSVVGTTPQAKGAISGMTVTDIPASSDTSSASSESADVSSGLWLGVSGGNFAKADSSPTYAFASRSGSDIPSYSASKGSSSSNTTNSVTNNYNISVDGRSTSVNQAAISGTKQILSVAAQAQNLGFSRRG